VRGDYATILAALKASHCIGSAPEGLWCKLKL
jgi:hypothetical protein